MEIFKKIENKEKIDCDELLDEIIAFQLKKMEKYENKGRLSENSELVIPEYGFVNIKRLKIFNVHFDC